MSIKNTKKRGKVLVFSTRHVVTGGIESHLREFCKNLGDSGVDIDFIVLNATMDAESEKNYKKYCRKTFFGSYGESQMRFIWLFGIAFKLWRTKYDAIYTNGQGSSIFLVSKLFPFKRLWVHHHHTAGDEQDVLSWTSIYWKSLKLADNIVACSRINADRLKNILQRPIDVIYCFSKKVSPDYSISKQSLKIDLGYYGRLIPEKGIEILCQLSEDTELQVVKFHIWGEGEVYPVSYFKDYPNINFHGKFDGREELANVINSLDGMLLITTYPEGLPISLLEAMSAGLPWLATDKGGILDIAVDPKSTRVIPAKSNYLDIKKAILSFAHDLENGSISRDAQIANYKNGFSSSVLTVKWKTLFNISTN